MNLNIKLLKNNVMPAQYEAMKAKFIKDGLSVEAAKTKAAKIYQSIRKKNMSLPKLSNKKD